MIDKIQPNTPTRYTSAASTKDNKVSKSRPEAKEAKNVSTEVLLSDEAQVLQRLMQAVKDAPDVRQDVVDKIREKINAGEYEIDFEALGQQLVRFMK
jgi:negative regulator of flagellin synthesis FlgM